jgi:chitodextrinase
VKKLIFLFAFLLVGVAAAAPSVVSTTETSATVEGLDCGSKYRFDIRKYNADGTLSSTTSSVEAQTKACPDTQPPSAPQNLAASGATQTSISVSWSASTDDIGVTGYDVYRNGIKVDSTSATSYTFGGLSCGTSYALAVEAHDAAGKRSAASAITASTAACPPPSCPTGEYTAQYFGNMTLSGAPVLQRCEAAINHDWGSGSPGASVPPDRFSTRWTREASFTAGTYQFTATADDGIRIWVDGTSLIDSWKDQAPTTYQATRILTAGEHVVKVEYYENGGGAVARVSWQPVQLPLPGGNVVQPGQSWDAACDAAQPGAVLEAAPGNHGSQAVTCAKAAPGVTFRAQSGATMHQFTVRSSTNLTFRDIDSNRFSIDDANQNISIIGGDVGPTLSSNATGQQQPSVGATSTPSQNVRIEGVRFHDHDQADGRHTECLQIGGVSGLTISRSTFRDCAGTASLMVGRYAEAVPSRDVVIENNFFYGNDGASSEPLGNLQYARSEPGLIIRYNTFVGSSGYSVFAFFDHRPALTPSARIYGNVSNSPGHSQPDGYGPCDKLAVYHHNVWRGASCSPTDLNADPKLVSLTDLHVQAGSPAIDRGDPADYPAVDIDGDVRPAGGAPDAGADETTAVPAPPPGDATPPTQPTGLTVQTRTATSLSLTWAASSDNVAVAGYGVYLNGTRVQTPSQPGATVTGLTCGSAYTVQVDAYDAAGNRSTRAELPATTSACPDTQPPSVPANLQATSRTATSIVLAWSPSSDSVGVVGYDVYRGGAKVDSTSATTYTFGGLSCGTSYTLAVEARDAAGNRSAASAITASTAACPPPSCPTGQYAAQYYGNVTLSGTPALQRCEAAINHNWGTGSPGTGVPADRFSTRWTGTHSFTAGTYQFTATADDGIRVWIDGVPLIDSWKDQAPTTYQAARILTAGEHVVKVEYYENGGGAVARVSWQLSQPPVSPPPPPPSGEAALAVSTTGSDATCVRGDLSRACATLNKAYSLAQCGDVVEVREGSYGLQQLVETSLSACSTNVVFRPAVGAAVSVQQIEFGNGGLFSGNAADRVTIRDLKVRNAIFVWGDSENIDLINIDGGSIGIQGGWNIRVLGGDFGPCDSSGPSACRERMWITSDNRVAHGVTRNVLIEGATIHDYSITGAGDHWECMYTTGGENVVLRGNKFYNCAIYAIAVGPRDWSKYDPWLIENNWFGLACNTPNNQPAVGCGTARPSAIMLGGTSFEAGGDIVIRYNSFADVSTVNTEGNQGLSSKIKILGNILGSIDGACLPNVAYAYNVIHDDTRCGADSVLISGPMPYVNADARAAMDYHLAGPSVADGYVPATAPYLDLAMDFDQQLRRVPRTAGSDER